MLTTRISIKFSIWKRWYHFDGSHNWKQYEDSDILFSIGSSQISFFDNFVRFRNRGTYFRNVWNLFKSCGKISEVGLESIWYAAYLPILFINLSFRKNFVSEYQRSFMREKLFLIYCFNKNSCWNYETNLPVKDSSIVSLKSL